jgi:hypothetical protein
MDRPYEFRLDKKDLCNRCIEYIKRENKIGVCSVALSIKGHRWPYQLDSEGFVTACPKFKSAKQLKMEVMNV